MKGALITVAAIVLVGGAMISAVIRISGGPDLRYQDMDGAAIYNRLCTQCHGPDGRALGKAGASYRGKRQYWTEESLLEYVADPAAFQRRDPRLRGQYMPPIDGTMPAEARLRLVRHVLSLMDELEGSGR